MSELHKISVNLSDGQKRKLAKAYRDKEEVSIKLSNKNLSGSDTLLVPKNTANRVAKSKSLGKGAQIKISKANVRKQTGSGIASSVLPVLRNVAPTIGKTLGLSALAGLASEGVSQVIKKNSGGQIFQVPNQHLFRLAMLSELLNKGQIRDLAKAHKDGSDMLFKITQKQVGNGIGSILASIGIPMIIDALRGKGVGRGGPRLNKSGGGGPRVSKMSGGAGPRIGLPMYPPPFIGNWPSTSGRGKKKNDLNLRPRFKKTVPMSNFDLIEWCKYLKIPIKNVLSRDQTVQHNHKLALFIYNLEPSYLRGSHWIATYVKDNVINYFDSFGMMPFQEMVDHAKRENVTLLHQNQQLQNLYTSTCGYFCLYFLNEMNKGIDYFDLLQVFKQDTNYNEKFIEKYFKRLEKKN